MFLTAEVAPTTALRRNSHLFRSCIGPNLHRLHLSKAMADLMSDLRQAKRYRFGVFEADAATGELRRQGMRVKLNAQPFQILLMLLNRPGELITRDEISRVLWPEGTFVDYEHGVNSAVNRIREALGDKANNPKFIETLARRGYRFVALVQPIALNEDLSLMDSKPTAQETQSPVSDRSESEYRIRFLSSASELPKTSYQAVQTFFVLLQVMYLGFYVGALANLAEIEDLLS